jgi:hypothetical protein
MFFLNGVSFNAFQEYLLIPNRCPMIINERLLACSASLRRRSKSFLVHVLWFEQDRLHEVIACSQPCSDFPGFSHKSVCLVFLLAGIG